MNKLVFGDIEVTKKEFYANKKGIKLKDIIVNNIIVGEKVNNDILKYYNGHIVDDNVIPLILLLPIMSGWIKYFENGRKNMSFKIENDEVYLKYNEIWNKIKKLLGGIRLSSDIIYDDHYIKTKCISIDSVLKIEKYYPQVYLGQCKYKAKERKIKNLIDYDLDSDYESD